MVHRGVVHSFSAACTAVLFSAVSHEKQEKFYALLLLSLWLPFAEVNGKNYKRRVLWFISRNTSSSKQVSKAVKISVDEKLL